MARLSSLLLLPTVLLFASVLGNEIEQLNSPMTHLALHNQLYTTIHTNVQRFKGVDFSGKFVGKFEQLGGSGSYDGTFRGTKSSEKTKAIFAYKVGGVYKSMGFNVKYSGNVSGKLDVCGKRVTVHAGYTNSGSGTLRGKPLKGTAKGNVVFTAAADKSFSYRDQGTIRMYIAGKLINAKYYATLNNDSVNVAVNGMYGGKKFFVKYSFSLNLLPLVFDMNPLMVTRNYGTMYVTADGKTTTRNFDVRGMQLPKIE